jgi:hypothetical protein
MSQAITKILYEYNDAAVPPPYHRSYKITVTPNRCHLMVHAYGKIILDKQCTIERAIWERLVKDASTLPIQALPKAADPQDSTGGSSRFITLYSEDQVVLKGTALPDEVGDEPDSPAAFAHRLMSLCPDFPSGLAYK